MQWGRGPYQLTFRLLPATPASLTDASHIDTCLVMVWRQCAAECMRGDAVSPFQVGHLDRTPLCDGLVAPTRWPPGRSLTTPTTLADLPHIGTCMIMAWWQHTAGSMRGEADRKSLGQDLPCSVVMGRIR